MAGLLPKIEHATAQVSRDDLVCPECEYSLRGLPGDMVNCPECGRSCDLAAMMTRSWHGPWYKAPDYNLVLGPVVGAVLGGLVMAIAQARVGLAGRFTGHALAMLCVVFWGWLLYHVWRRWPGAQGLLLALLAHLLVTGYLVGLVMVIGGVIGVLVNAFYGLLALLGALTVWLCQCGERFIAGQCIRRYLRQPAASEEK